VEVKSETSRSKSFGNLAHVDPMHNCALVLQAVIFSRKDIAAFLVMGNLKYMLI